MFLAPATFAIAAPPISTCSASGLTLAGDDVDHPVVNRASDFTKGTPRPYRRSLRIVFTDRCCRAAS